MAGDSEADEKRYGALDDSRMPALTYRRGPCPQCEAMVNIALSRASTVALTGSFHDILERIAELEAALRPFAAIDGVAVPRFKVDPAVDRLWSYYESRTDTQYEITRAHIIEAGRVLSEK